MNNLPFNGWKSIVGAAMIAASVFLPGLSGALMPLGISLLGIGLAHKLEKLMEALRTLTQPDEEPRTLRFPDRSE
jgi:predicted phage tail protein